MPRKTSRPGEYFALEGEASMRPRPDAAENAQGAARLPGRHRAASMRPRPDAAENPFRPAAILCASELQ